MTVPTQRKEVDDVLGGDAAWANVDKTQGACQGLLLFLIIYILSADIYLKYIIS